MKDRKKSTKRKYSKRIVILCIVSVLLFSTASFIIQLKTGMEVSSTLTTCFFSFFGIEILSLAGIKKTKTKNIRYDEYTSMSDNIEIADEAENFESEE